MGNIIITEKQLNLLVNKLKNNVNESHEEGSYMAKEQLYTIATLAMKMWESMEDGTQLEDWQETKIAQSEQSIISVVKHFTYGDVESKEMAGGMDRLDFGDIVIGQ